MQQFISDVKVLKVSHSMYHPHDVALLIFINGDGLMSENYYY